MPVSTGVGPRCSPLHSRDACEIAKMLVEHGAEIGVRADNNQSALDMALSNGHGATATFLEQQGARLQ